MKKTKILSFILLIIFLMFSCIREHGGEVFKQQGVYECKNKKNAEASVYKFDSRSDFTKVFLKKNHRYLEFFDLNSGQIIRLYENIHDYSCQCVKASNHE